MLHPSEGLDRGPTTERKKKKRRKQPSTLRDLNPRPHEMFVLPLCYNRFPDSSWVTFFPSNRALNSAILAQMACPGIFFFHLQSFLTPMQRTGFEPTSQELHQTGTFGRPTDWATRPRWVELVILRGTWLRTHYWEEPTTQIEVEIDLLRVALLVPRLVGVADGDVVGLAVLVRSHGLEKNGGTGSNTAFNLLLKAHCFVLYIGTIGLIKQIISRDILHSDCSHKHAHLKTSF